MDTNKAEEIVASDYEHAEASPELPDAAHELLTELCRMRQVVREYVNEVESGEKFDALVRLVPGLVSDDGVYPMDVDRYAR